MLPVFLSQSKWIGTFVIMNVWLALMGQNSTDSFDTNRNFSLEQAHVEPQMQPQLVGPIMPLNSQIADTITDKPIPNEVVEVAKPTNISAQNYQFIPNLETDLSKYSAVEVVATGYSAGKESTGKGPDHPEYGITFSGLKVIRDNQALSTIAADPKIFPLGTVLFIPGYGYGVVADIGSAIKGKKIDLFFNTKDEVYREWGKKTVTVFVVKKGSGKVTEVIWNQLKDDLTKKVL
jgi:3D (Asp-Asp-Asp) domain-containing protein